jgi:hypothetical protein
LPGGRGSPHTNTERKRAEGKLIHAGRLAVRGVCVVFSANCRKCFHERELQEAQEPTVWIGT